MSPDSAAVTLRDGRLDDLPALLALEARFPGDRLSARQFRRHLASTTAHLRVAERGAAFAGYALLFQRRGSRIARLYSIAVDPSARGLGIGNTLLADAETIARSTGAVALRLEVRTDNPAAVALYRSRGFDLFGRHPGYYADGCDALRFEKVLATA